MPTLYSTMEKHRKPKPSLIEMVLYNMSPVLAGVAAGYDVRMSNLSPIHPSLQSQLIQSCTMENNDFQEPNKHNFISNTYHGHVKHNRPQLTSISTLPDDKSCDKNYMTSTQSTTSGVTSNFTTHSGMSSSASFQPPIPSPRRCRPNDSLSDYGNLNPDSDKQRAPIYVPGDYRINFQTNSSSGNPFIDESTKDTQEDLSRYAAYFGSNYFPYKPDANLAYTRDYRSFPDYGYTERESFDNRQSLHDSLSPPGSGNFNDYRSPDSQTSAINHGYQDDFEHPCGKLSSKFQSLEMNYSDTVSTPTGLNRMRGYESVPLRLSDNTQYSSNTNPFLPLDDVNEEKTHQLEHGGLQTTSRLRSSLKKNNSSSHKLQSSGSQTPEHGTSDDSSYMSAKENSLSSQQSRVRFSPDNLFEVSDDGMQNANVRMNFTR